MRLKPKGRSYQRGMRVEKGGIDESEADCIMLIQKQRLVSRNSQRRSSSTLRLSLSQTPNNWRIGGVSWRLRKMERIVDS